MPRHLPNDPRFPKKNAVKTYQCSFCPKGFPDLGQLMQHEDAHEGEPISEGNEQIPAENKDENSQKKPVEPRIPQPRKPNFPYGYGQK